MLQFSVGEHLLWLSLVIMNDIRFGLLYFLSRLQKLDLFHTHPCKTRDNLWPELSSPAFSPCSNSFPTHLAHSLKSLPSLLLTRWSHKMTALPTERLSDPISVRLPGWPLSPSWLRSLYLLRETLLQRYAKAEGWDDPWGFGWRCEGSSRPECSPSHRVSRLTWPVRPSTDQAFILPSPGAWTPNKATIWSPWISKSFSFWFPLSLASVFPLCSGRRVGFLLSVMDCLVNWV